MTYEISIEGTTTKEELHDCIIRQLPVPEYYGKNLDALRDVLTELPTDTGLFIWIDGGIDLTDASTIPFHLKGFFRMMEDVAKEREDLDIRFLSDAI